MTLDIDPARFLAPVSADLPCGEDLDEAGDLDFLNGLAQAESQLPDRYLYRDGDTGALKVFDRSLIDFGRESRLLLDLLDRTRDLRLLTVLGRLAMLDRDLRGFGQVLAAVADLLEARWESVHPCGAGGDYGFRAAILQGLENNPTVILPLQHTTLFRSRRHGPISFRTLMAAAGEVPQAGDDPGPDRTEIARALEGAEPGELETAQAELAAVADAVGRIGAVTRARGGREGVVSLAQLGDLVRRMREFVGTAAPTPAATGAGAPEAAPAEPSPGQPAPQRPVGAITSAAQAAAALAAAASYLRTHEPSSPAEVLVRQAQTLVGKSFVEVMRILMPDRAPDVAIVLGAGRRLRLTFDQLAAVPDECGTDPGSDREPDADRDADPEAPAAAEPAFRAATRAEAVALLREIGDHFRRSEPASPIPLLLEKAAALADRDFLAVLKDVLSEDQQE